MSPRMGEELAVALALEGRLDAVQGETKQLLAVADMVATLPEPEIDAAFADALEKRLLTEGMPAVPAGRPQLRVVREEPVAPVESPERAAVVRMPTRRHVVRRGAVAVAAVVALGAFPSVAAAKSLPGSPFYDVKQFHRQVQLWLARGPVADGMTHARIAAAMAGEAQQLAAFPEPNREAIDSTLAEVADRLTKARNLILGNARDAATLTALADLARQTETSVTAVGSRASGTHVEDAITASRSIQAAVASALGSSSGARAGAIVSAEAPAVVAPAAKEIAPSLDGPTLSEPQKPSTWTKDTERRSDKRDPERDSGTGKAVNSAKQEGCEAIFEAQLGHTLAYATDLMCGMDNS